MRQITNIDASETYKKLFQDFANHRDRIKKAGGSKTLQLSKVQEKQLLNLARKSYRQREISATRQWMIQLFRETNQFFDSLVMRQWPCMRGK